MDPFLTLVDWIKSEESFVDHVYNDGYGNLTIGYGDTRPEILKKYRKGITEAQASEELAALLSNYWSSVASMVVPGTTDNQMVAFTSLAYNIGLGGFEESTALREHNAGNTAAAAAAILLWNKAEDPNTGQLVVSDGLVKRRRREHDLYLSGPKPTALPLDPPQQIATIGLVCLESALCLDIEGESGDNGASIIQWPEHGRVNQEFALFPIPDRAAGEVAIVCTHKLGPNGKPLVFDVAMWSTENGARVQQWEYHGGANQRWRVISAVGNVLMFQNVHSSKVLDVRGHSVDPGGDLQQWDRLDGQNQLFLRVRQERTAVINPVLPGPTPPPPDPEKPAEPDSTFDVGDALSKLGGFPLSSPGFADPEDVYGFQAGFSFWDLALDGDAGPETVRALKYSLENGGRCGKYFSFSEFACKHCGRCRIMAFHVKQMDQYRERVGSTPIISGTRCTEHNAAVGGALNSQHRPYPDNRGMSTACDIPGAVDLDTLLSWKLFSGEGYVPSEGNIVVHVDSRGDGPNNPTGGTRDSATTWTY